MTLKELLQTLDDDTAVRISSYDKYGYDDYCRIWEGSIIYENFISELLIDDRYYNIEVLRVQPTNYCFMFEGEYIMGLIVIINQPDK